MWVSPPAFGDSGDNGELPPSGPGREGWDRAAKALEGPVVGGVDHQESPSLSPHLSDFPGSDTLEIIQEKGDGGTGAEGAGEEEDGEGAPEGPPKAFSASWGSIYRFRRALAILYEGGARPTHMVTLTLPGAHWPVVLARNGGWLAVKNRFLKLLRKYLEQEWPGVSVLWFQEVQKRGAPHLHLLMDFGPLSDEDWREVADTIEALWAYVLGEKARTRVERLRRPDFGYAGKYASKAAQKRSQGPALRAGKWWGLIGPWRAYMRSHRAPLVMRLEAKQARAIAEGLASRLEAKGHTKIAKRFRAFAQGHTQFAYLLAGPNVGPITDMVFEVLEEVLDGVQATTSG